MKYQIQTEAQKQSLLKIIEGMKPGVIVEIREHNKRRSDAQNRLLWVWNNEIQRHLHEHFGETASAEEWHDILVSKLMPAELTKVSLPTGESFKVGRTRTRNLGVKKMAEYMQKLEAYCVESLCMILPHPDDYMFAVYGERK